jgi:hypothetical protein
MNLYRFVSFLTLLIPLCSYAQLPKGWSAGGFRHEGGYEVTAAKESTGDWSLLIRSTPQWKTGESNAGTAFAADSYRGKRVRLTAMVKTEDVATFAGLWFHVLGAAENSEKPKMVRFDNMHERAVKGTTAWVKYSIVQDVPLDGKTISIGSYLVGPGKVWLSQPTFEEVGKDVPLTSSGGSPADQLPNHPQLDLSLR